MDTIKHRNVDEYIATFPKNIRAILEEIRGIIKEAAPLAEETISYNMPGYKLHGPLVYFAGNKEHIGFYPTPSPIVEFKKELAKYNTSKGAIQFPIGEPIPTELVKAITLFRVHENEEKAKAKKKK